MRSIAIGLAVLAACATAQRSRRPISSAHLGANLSAPARRHLARRRQALQGLSDKRLLRDGPAPFAPPPAFARRALSYRAFRRRSCGPSGRADPSLPPAMSLLLQPDRTRARQCRIDRRRMGRSFSSGGGNGRAAIASFGRRADRAKRSRTDPRLRGRRGALHQSRSLRACCSRASNWSGWRASASIMCRFRSRTSIPRTPIGYLGYKGGLAKKREVARWTRELGLGLTDQRADAPAKSRSSAGDHRFRG